MKVKGDFVTNSSSTSFFFVTKTDSISDFLKKLVENKNLFQLSHDISWTKQPHVVSIDVFNVIEEIESILPKKIHHIDYMLESLKSVIDNCGERLLYSSEDEPYHRFEQELMEEYEKKLLEWAEFKNKGFTHYYQIGFGDNDGDISGGDVGNTMDYSGRYIGLRNDDFIIFTEQNR